MHAILARISVGEQLRTASGKLHWHVRFDPGLDFAGWDTGNGIARPLDGDPYDPGACFDLLEGETCDPGAYFGDVITLAYTNSIRDRARRAKVEFDVVALRRLRLGNRVHTSAPRGTFYVVRQSVATVKFETREFDATLTPMSSFAVQQEQCKGLLDEILDWIAVGSFAEPQESSTGVVGAIQGCISCVGCLCCNDKASWRVIHAILARTSECFNGVLDAILDWISAGHTTAMYAILACFGDVTTLAYTNSIQDRARRARRKSLMLLRFASCGWVEQGFRWQFTCNLTPKRDVLGGETKRSNPEDCHKGAPARPHDHDECEPGAYSASVTVLRYGQSSRIAPDVPDLKPGHAGCDPGAHFGGTGAGMLPWRARCDVGAYSGTRSRSVSWVANIQLDAVGAHPEPSWLSDLVECVLVGRKWSLKKGCAKRLTEVVIGRDMGDPGLPSRVEVESVIGRVKSQGRGMKRAPIDRSGDMGGSSRMRNGDEPVITALDRKQSKWDVLSKRGTERRPFHTSVDFERELLSAQRVRRVFPGEAKQPWNFVDDTPCDRSNRILEMTTPRNYG
ncbi:hypothetical protein FA15DRAFT_661189 [Coprinopsis marcescibilis]|uniref:Uncharacterized protein n=1 Tax=Coprinopsis marcescibilis TaxID=230819 RepID=A0A5C3KCU7_COPMA|nr:hypothetical protein FA15DRAFT_661189 [Coprinopsis marcescibilis]